MRRTVIITALTALFLALSATSAQAAGLLQTNTELSAIRSHIRHGDQPWASAWTWFRGGLLRIAMDNTPHVYGGPCRTDGSGTALEDALDRDGARARSAAIGYALTGTTRYASKARAYLLAWARNNTPTTFAHTGDRYTGSYQSHGAFSFAYAYDLTKSSSVYSAADRLTIKSYFRRFTNALETFITAQRTDWVMTHPTASTGYEWSSNPLGLRYNRYDRYIGCDGIALTQLARLALARESGYTTEISQLLNRGNVMSAQSIIRKASAPRNSGDGVAGHPNPVPQLAIFKAGYYDNSSRGGAVDYMTYGERAVSMLLIMARRAGADVSAETALVKRSWTYLARFYGPNAERSPVPRDVVNTSVGLPRFVLPLRLFGDQFLPEARAGDERSYNESQFLGPVTLMFWR